MKSVGKAEKEEKVEKVDEIRARFCKSTEVDAAVESAKCTSALPGICMHLDVLLVLTSNAVTCSLITFITYCILMGL